MKREKSNLFLGIILVISTITGYFLEYKENQSNITEIRTIATDVESTYEADFGERGEMVLPKDDYDGRININTAGKEELKRLDGIGDKKANNIIKYREKHGKFEVIEDIMKVSGIGKNIFEDIKEFIVVE